MQAVFFEDDSAGSFLPLTLTRPVDNLRVGILTIAKKWQTALETEPAHRLLREELRDVFPSPAIDPEKDCLWINSRYLPGDQLKEEVTKLDTGSCLRHGDTVIAACIDGATSHKWMESGRPDFSNLFVIESQDFLSVRNLWDLFRMNGEQIRKDIGLLKLTPGTGKATIASGVVFEQEDSIYLDAKATIEAGCVLDASKGPIYIGAGATVMAGSVLRGPLAVCKNSIIKMGARIYGDTTVGPVCKVGGEVSNTLFHSYSNKAHDGYIGNSVVGQWCNLGAGTTISNLKTNYSNVRISDWKSREEIDTGLQFFGLVMGDHSKTAINCVVNSGTVMGVNCNILSRDFPPKFIPSFSWVGSNVIQPYKLDKAVETMGIMMKRRDVDITEGYKKMMAAIHKKSRH